MDTASAKPKETIFDIARSCLELFSAFVSDSRPSSVTIVGEQQRFWAWSNTLKVFAKPHICLDEQLRADKYDQIRRMVLLLLGVLRQNLSLALESTDIIEAGQKTSSGLIQSTGIDKQPDGDPVEVALFGIAGSVKRLERIAAVILQATQGSLARRVSAYAKKRRAKENEKGVKDSIEDHIAGVIRHRFQGAISPSLSQQLLDACLYRHYRILYERSHRDPELSRLSAPLQATEPSSQSHVLDAEPTGPTLVIGAKSKEISISKPDEETRSEQTRPLTIDENVVREKLAEDSSAQPQPSSPPSVSETGAALYPNPPHIPDGQKEAKCPICLEIFPVEKFEWSQWKLHVDKDIQPFVCVSEDCSKNLQFFDNRQLWMSHMRKTHTSLWIRHLHNAILWKCTLCGSKKTKYYKSEKELSEHMNITHSEIEEQERQDIAWSSSIPQSRPVDVCPICGDSHLPQTRPAEEEALEAEDKLLQPPPKEVSEQKKKARVQFVTPNDPSKGTKVGLDSRQDTAPQISQETKDHGRIEKYVGKHLQALAYYFSNRLIEDQEGQANSSEGRNADASSSGLEGLPAVEHNAALPKFEYDEDPPKLPILYQEGRVNNDEVELVENNRRELIQTWDWNEKGRVPEPPLASEDLERFFPDVSLHSSIVWKGLTHAQAFEFTALIFLGMELCKQMASAVLNETENSVPVPQQLTLIISAFVKAIEECLPFFGSESKSSDFVLALQNFAVESRNDARELIVLTQDHIHVFNDTPEDAKRALDQLNDRVRRRTENLRFKLILARIDCKEDPSMDPELGPSIPAASSTEFSRQIAEIVTAIAVGDDLFLETVEKQATLIAAKPNIVELVDHPESLAERILEHYAEDVFDVPARHFFPRDCISKLITKAAIVAEMQEDDRESTKLDVNIVKDQELVEFIFNPAKRIFAIVALCGFEGNALRRVMQDFKNNNFHDDLLPLKEEMLSRLPGFSDTRGSRLKSNNFLTHQFELLAPVFKKSSFGLDLEPRHIFPFIWVSDQAKYGNLSMVRQIKIHSAHHDFMTDNGGDTLALMEIKGHPSSYEKETIDRTWKAEAMALHEISKLNHYHIVPCIAAITRGSERYFMFPWADGGNLRDLWANTPQPNLDPGFVEAIVRQLRGLADALNMLHNHKKGSVRHGDLRPEKIFVFKDKTSVGILKIAITGQFRSQLVATPFGSRSNTQNGIPSYQPPEVMTNIFEARTRLSDIWSMGCILLELLVWLLYGYAELKGFNDSLRNDDSGERGAYFLVDRNNQEGVSLHPHIQACLEHISGDPECSDDTAIRDLLKIVRRSLLVLRLPEQGPDLLGPAVDESKESGRRVSFAPPIPLTPPGPSRATAGKFLASLDDIIRKGELNESYWFSGKIRSQSLKGPRSNPHQANQNYLSPDSASQLNTPLDRRNLQKPIEITGSDLADSSILKSVWEFPIDNQFASSMMQNLSTYNLYPKVKEPRLCSKCATLRFWDPFFKMEDTLLELQEDSKNCDFCKMRWDLSKQFKLEEFSVIRFEKVGSALRINDHYPPVLSLCRGPDLTPQTSDRAPVQIGLPVLPNAGSEPHLEILWQWLKHCNENHPKCRPPVVATPPTRLIQIGDDSLAPIRLYETKPKDSMEYVALSHPWGPPPHFSAFTSNVDEMRERIEYDKLPANFQHAVQITRALGFRYLWIDSICVIQGPDGDFHKEAERMEEVFSSASCVLNASSSNSQTDGILKERDQREYLAFVQDQLPIYVCQFIDDYDKHVLKSPFNTRGWALQERVLARRTIYFTDKQTFWECGGGVHCETLTRMNNKLASFIADPNFPQLAMGSSSGGKISIYQDLYRHYSRLQLGRTFDRPIAIAGLEKRLIGAFKTVGGFGVFDDGRGLLCRALLWHRGSDETTLFRIIFPADHHLKIPTWSWMAYEGGIDYLDLPLNGIDWKLDEILSPWHVDSVASTWHTGDQKKTEIKAIARTFAISRRDGAEYKLIYDIPETFDDSSREVKCVVVGTLKTKDSLKMSDSLKTPNTMHFVLLITMMGILKDSQASMYQRVGVGQIPGRCINFYHASEEVYIR